MRQSKRQIVATVVLFVLLGMSRIVTAGPDKQLVVLSASLNRATETLILKGQNFGSSPAVFCELLPMTVLSATDTQLVVYFPASMPEGSFLITISRQRSTGPRRVLPGGADRCCAARHRWRHRSDGTRRPRGSGRRDRSGRRNWTGRRNRIGRRDRRDRSGRTCRACRPCQGQG